MLMKLLIPIFIGALSSCATATVERDLTKVKPGMDKDAVLALVGNPKRTFRAQSKDHWIYAYYRADRQFAQTVTFESGRVKDISTSRLYRSASGDDVDEVGDYQDFEKQMSDQVKGSERRGEFKDVDAPSTSSDRASESEPKRSTNSDDSSSRDDDSSSASSRDDFSDRAPSHSDDD